MSNEPTVSVIMPTYNEEGGVRQAVRSITEQTYDDLELVIVDGGSTDGTLTQIAEINDDRIRVLREAEPQGISHALNRGIEESAGKYVARMDADDRSLPNRISIQLSVLESRPEIELVTSWYRVVGRGGTEITVHKIDNSRLFTADDLVENGPEFAHGSVMMRRNTIEQVGGYREPFDTAEDLDLWLRIAERCGGDSFHVVPQVMYEHRISADQMARRARQRVVARYAKDAGKSRRRGEDEPLEAAVEAARTTPVQSFSESQREAMYHYLVGVAKLRADETAGARVAFIRAIRVSPTTVHPWYKLLLSFLPASLRRRAQAGIQRMLL